MYWYSKYLDKIELTENMFIIYNDKLYQMYEKCIVTRGSNSKLNWFTYIKKDKKFKRLYNKDLIYKYRIIDKRDAIRVFPEEFI